MDRVVVITGGSRGIGRATALAVANRGYRVCIGYASNEAAAREVEQLQVLRNSTSRTHVLHARNRGRRRAFFCVEPAALGASFAGSSIEISLRQKRAAASRSRLSSRAVAGPMGDDLASRSTAASTISSPRGVS